MVSCQDTTKEELDVRESECNTRYGKSLEAGDVDLGPDYEMCRTENCFGVDMIDCEEQVVGSLEQD